MTESAAERVSVCIARGASDGIRYYRVADLDPADGRAAPALTACDLKDDEGRRDNPVWLKCPSAERAHGGRTSDFCVLRWRVDPSSACGYAAQPAGDDGTAAGTFDLREVVVVPEVADESSMRKALAEGVTFAGNAAPVVYLAFKRTGRAYLAARLERSDLEWRKGAFTLAEGSKVLSAPMVEISADDVCLAGGPDGSPVRRLYIGNGSPAHQGRVCLRPIEWYAADYAEWFTDKRAPCLAREARVSVREVVEYALSSPDAMDEYLGATPPCEEADRLAAAVAARLAEGGDKARRKIREALACDPDLREQCEAPMRAEFAALAAEREGLTLRVESLREEARALGDEVRRSKEALERLSEDAALRLGLKAVGPRASQASRAWPSPGVRDGVETEAICWGKGLAETLARNMGAFGVTCLAGDAPAVRLSAARSVEAALGLCRFMAMPQPVASALADALSVALTGATATRVWVPSDSRDTEAVEGLVGAHAGVVVVGNAVDPVNEGVVFSLLDACLPPQTTVVLPFVSRASARLLAPETWGRVFLPSVSGLAVFPAPPDERRLRRAAGGPAKPKVGPDEACDAAQVLADALPDLGACHQSLLLAGAVMVAAEGLVGDGDVEPLVADHLAMAGAGEDARGLVADWVGPAAGGLLDVR